MSRSRNLREQRRARRTAVRAQLAPGLTPLLRAAWDEACWAFVKIRDIVISPAELAQREFIARHEHRYFADFIRNLELLTRRIILAAAFALNLILKPLQPRARRARRQRRRRLMWPDKPKGWRVRFRFLARHSAPSRWIYPARTELVRTMDAIPLAKRLEAVRRVLARPNVYIRRVAIRLARLSEANTRANEPRKLDLRAGWQPHRIPTMGERFIAYGMKHAEPAYAWELDRWNEEPEPG